MVGGTTHVDLGSTVHDSGTVDRSRGRSTPEGTVDFKFYNEIDCAGTGAGTRAAMLSHAGRPERGCASVGETGALAAGSYGFKAHFIDAATTDVWQTATALCEPFTVDKGTADDRDQDPQRRTRRRR